MAEKEAQDSVSASDTILKVLAAEDSIPQSTGSATRTVTSVVRSTSSSSTGNGHHTQYQVQTIQTAGKTGVEPSETGRTPTQSHSVSLPEITSAVEKQEGTASDGGPSGLPDVARTWRSEPSFQTGREVTAQASHYSDSKGDDFPRRTRTHFTPTQLASMEEKFMENQYPDLKAREEIAKQLKLQEMQVQVWFQNHRAKLRRKNRRNAIQAPYNRPLVPQPPSFWPSNLPFDSNITDAGKGKPSEKSTKEIAAALQQRYPSRSHRSSSDPHVNKSTASSGSWSSQQQQTALHVAAPESHGQIIMGNYYSGYTPIETAEVDTVMGILATPSDQQPTNVQVITGHSQEQMQGSQRAQAVLIPMTGQPSNIAMHPQETHVQHATVSGSFSHPPATIYGMQHQQHSGEGYMVPVIASHSQMPVHTLGSVAAQQPPQAHFQSPVSRGQH
jgi:hypothetical protein